MHRPAAGLVVVGLGTSLAAMDLAVNVAFPSITAAFELETQAIRWLVVCYVLTYASLLLAFGRLGDLIGHRRVFRAGLIVSVFAYTACAVAPDYHWLLVARVVQGIATALVLSCAPALTTFLFDEAMRTRALGIYSGLFALASVVAPLIGGASIALFGWSGVYWFRVPVALAALLLLPLLPKPAAARAESAGSADLTGSILLALSLAMLLLCLTLMTAPDATGYALAAALAGLAGCAVFAYQQKRTRHPLLPAATIRQLDFVLLNLASVAVHFAVFAVPLLAPYYFARIADYSPAVSGVVLAFTPLGILAGSAAAPWIVQRRGVRATVALSGLWIGTCQFFIALWPANPYSLAIIAVLALHGIGIGVFQVAYADIVVAALPRRDRGVAGSLTIVTRTVGVVTAATALTALLQAIETHALASGADPPSAFLGAFGSVFGWSALALSVFFALVCVRDRAWIRR